MDIDNEIETYDEIAKSRIIGYIEPVLNTNNVSITVIGYKSKNGRYKALIDKIARRIFTPVGKFTVPKYKFDYDGDNILHNGFIEFSVKKISEEPNCKDNKYSIDFDVEIIPKDFLSILTLNGSHSLKHGFIAQDELNSSINKTELKNCSKQFLLKSGNFLYGLFKYEESSDSIKAINGKETNAYRFDNKIWLQYCTEVNQKTYYLGNKDELPFEWSKTIDCMDDQELADWFKDKLKSCAASEKIISMEQQLLNFIPKFKETDNAILDEIRLDRIKTKLPALKFTFDEIKELMNSNSSLTYMLNETLKTMKNEYRSTWASSLDAEKAELKSEIASLEAAKFSIQSELEEKQFKLDELKENSSLSGMKSKDSNMTKDFFNSVEIEPIIFEANGLPFTQLMQEKIGYDFFKLLKENLEHEKIPKSFESKMNKESVLFTRKACFIPSVSWAYFYAKAIRNSKLYLIHVEHDWLHYKDFMNNGLEAVMNSCYENENVNHALVLEPLLDIISGYSIIIPGIGKPLPKNLKIFATILPFKEDNKIGLQLNKENFTHWRGISKIEDKLIISPDFLEINTGEGYFEPKDIFMDYDKASIVYDDNDQKLLSKSKTEFEKTIESLADTEKKKLKTIYEEYNEYFE